MQHSQQKHPKSDDEFEQLQPQIQTVTQPNFYLANPSHKTYYPRHKVLSQKQKLGLVITPNINEMAYSCYQQHKKSVVIGKVIKIGSFTFRSNYQSGSIGAVDLIGNNSFKIFLDPQSNSARGNSWFYFTVEGVKGEANFMIKGFTKRSSLYNSGMKICFRDNKEPTKWRRGGTRISYEPCTQNEDEQKVYCLKFTFFFKTNEYSSIQFAYSFPYSYQKLITFLPQIQHKAKCGVLCPSYEGRHIPLITIGNPNSKELIVISSRVHPGETGSSFIVEGFLKQIVADLPHAQYLRERYLFKVVPMINVDGVYKGNFRFSAVGVDLNRKWKAPTQQHHPQIFYLKEMIRKQSKERQLKMYIDIHGHSRKKNVFFYGCCPKDSSIEENAKAKAFPFLMGKIHNAYNYEDCAFGIQKQKEGTARVTLFKEFRISEIFTLEASFCGPTGNSNFSENQYEKLGRKLCEGISAYFYQPEDNTPRIMNKFSTLKENVMKELTSSDYYLRVGNQPDSGSDSQPEKGSFPEKNCKTEVTKKEHSRKRNSGITSAQNNNRVMVKIPSNVKQKSEASIITQEKDTREKDLYMYLLEAPTQLFDADFRSKQTTQNRVHSLSKQATHKHSKSKTPLFQDEGYCSLNANNKNEKGKINLMIGREGAQYRRVRKIAEQSLKADSSELSSIHVKGIRGNKIEIDSRRNRLKASLQEKSKLRRTSAEAFFRKNIKVEQRVQLSKNEINVLCRGKQIHL